MPKGGERPGQNRRGRPKGSKNKATRDIKALAGKYAPDALKELARLAEKAKSEQARVAACKEILDRAYGRPAQAITGDGGGPVRHIHGLAWMTQDQALARGWA